MQETPEQRRQRLAQAREAMRTRAQESVLNAYTPMLPSAEEMQANTAADQQTAQQYAQQYWDQRRWKGGGLLGAGAAWLLNRGQEEPTKQSAYQSEMTRLSKAREAALLKAQRQGLNAARQQIAGHGVDLDKTFYTHDADYNSQQRTFGQQNAMQQDRQDWEAGKWNRVEFHDPQDPTQTFALQTNGREWKDFHGNAVPPEYLQRLTKKTFGAQTSSAKAVDKVHGKERLDHMLGHMADEYFKLQNMGANVDPQASLAENVFNFARAQLHVVGMAAGTQDAAVRQTIENARPLLIASIKKATGMTGREMDSNTELQFYLQAASDTSRDIESNLAALVAISDLFGVGADHEGQGVARARQFVGDRETMMQANMLKREYKTQLQADVNEYANMMKAKGVDHDQILRVINAKYGDKLKQYGNL